MAWIWIPVLGMYVYSHAHDHRAVAEPAPTLVGLRVDDGRLTVHLNLCGEKLQEVRVVSWDEEYPEPRPIWRGSTPRGPLAEPGTIRLGEAGPFDHVFGELPGPDASALWVEVSTKRDEHYASTGLFAMASIPADLPPDVYWTNQDGRTRTALEIDSAAPCASPGVN